MANRLFASMRNLFSRKKADGDLKAEIEAHVQILTDEYVAGGMSSDAARRAALVELGGAEQVRAEVREARSGVLLEQLCQDIRYGIRMLRKAPSFAVLAVLTLALGIGANTAMFSVIDGVLLQKPPFADPSRVAVAWQKQPNGNINIFSTPAYLEWKRQRGPLSSMAALVSDGHALGTGESLERIVGWKASAEIFSVLGVMPAIGRAFTSEEDRPGAGKIVLLSNALWKTRFQSDRNILGEKIDLDGVPYSVIGVMPPGFHIFNNTEQFYEPLQLQTQDTAAQSRAVHWILALFHRDANQTLKQSQSAVDATVARLHHDDPNSDAGFGVQLQTYQDVITSEVRTPLLLLMGSVGFVLLIACSNVANLLLARGTARRLEMSIRIAVGARRSRVVRQLLTESLVLALMGGGLGLGIAVGALRMLVALNPSSIPNIESIAMDTSVLLFTLMICLGVGILFGIAPALSTSRVDLSNALREATRTASHSGGRHRTVLVVSETALASILLIGAGLSLKSLWKVGQVEPGFNPHGLLTFRISASARFKNEPYDFYQQVAEKVGSLPGVQAAVLARDVPMSGTDPSMPIAVDGKTPQVIDGQIVTRLRIIGPGYFHAFQTPLVRGREFTMDDVANSHPVVIVSQSLAERYWPKLDPIGRSLRPNIADAPWYTVVGVAADVRHQALDTDIEPSAYYNYTQVPKSMIGLLEGFMTVTVRTAGNPTALSEPIRRAVAQIDKTVPVDRMKTVEEMLSDAGSLRRFDMWLFGAFAVLALTLAAVGVYGVMAYLVAQRTREIGIRMALGARRVDVMRMIVARGAKMALAGVLVGIIGAFALTRIMASLLYQVSPTDLWTFVLVAVSVLTFILIACYVPSLRATRVDPNVALRCE
ncbi:MAG TPA: ABC transporter permease [Candidatus Angelobacter sp.]|jgi:putative ABC transport system permease protein